MDSKILYGIAGVILGGSVGSLITYNILKKHVETEIDTAVIEIKAHYDIQAKKAKSGPYSSLDEIAKQYREAQRTAYLEGLRNIGYASEEEADADPKFDKAAWINESGFDASIDLVEEETVEEDDPEEVAYTDRDKRRNGDGPYVISYEEFSEEHSDFSKTTISYFVGDDTLADEREEVIPDATSIVGNDALTRFGDGSHDKNIVYVRNEHIGVDYEVTRNPGKYSVIVLNMPEEKPKRAPRKMKVSD